ncbi:MAG: hypothetical protein IJ391_09665, partial [Clostridia bacterium]|nr:hypothetical protein [Clostridia bacterium]
EAEYENFSRFAGRLALQSERRAKIKKLEAELCRTASLLSEWPRMADELKLAQSLSKEKAERELTDKYNAAKKLYDELSEYTSRLDGKVCPDADDISAAKAASAAIIRLENELCGMNISAKIKMLGGNRLEVRSLRTGELLDGSGEDIAITEAVSLIIPDVAQILLSPADVDTVSIAKQAEKQRADLDGIYEKYGVDTVDGLEQLAQEYAQLKSSVDAYGMRLSAVLGDTEIDELEASVKSITASPRAGDEIAYQIKQLCGETELSRFIARLEALIAKNESDHGSIDMLKEKALDIKSELERSQASLECGSDIPEEYMLISDPEAHTAKLKQLFELSRQEKERALSAKASAASALEAYRSTLEDEPVSVLEQAKIGFAEQKELLDHWLGIKEAFEKQKSELTDSPMNDIAQKFTHYLGEISQGGIYSEFPDADKLDMNIYSNDRLLSYGKLSEGTKETVSLAFRLAVLDHLFPDGGAVVVFDDPLTDMDAERSARSCEMIKDFASRHQVIFLTCKEEYFDMLGGNKIIM